MTKKKKGILISIISFAVVLAIALPILIINIVKKNKGIDWDGFLISGFSEFSAMGAAVIDDSGVSTVAYAAGDAGIVASKKDKHDAHLVGFKKDGSFEKIKFKDEDGKTHNQNAKLIHLDVRGRFSIASFSNNSDVEYVDIEHYGYSFSVSDDQDREIYYHIDNVEPIDYYVTGGRSYSYEDSALFIIDNVTGKIYNMENIIDKIKEPIYEKYGEVSFILETINLNYVDYPFDVENILFSVEFYSDSNKMWLFEAKFKNNNIELTQRMNDTQMDNFIPDEPNGSKPYLEWGLFSDKFGNIIWNEEESSVYNYQKRDGSFGKIEGYSRPVLSPNGVIYFEKSGSQIYYLNALGEIELTTLSGIELIDSFKNFYNSNSKYKYLYKNENAFYFAYSNHGLSKRHALMKMVISEANDWEYSLEFVDFNDGIIPDYNTLSLEDRTSAAANDGYLYELASGVLRRYDIETGEHHVYESKYKFKSLEFNRHLGQVTFKAVDESTMMEVEGYFDENNEIVLGDFKDVNRGLNRVYVVKPLN